MKSSLRSGVAIGLVLNGLLTLVCSAPAADLSTVDYDIETGRFTSDRRKVWSPYAPEAAPFTYTDRLQPPPPSPPKYLVLDRYTPKFFYLPPLAPTIYRNGNRYSLTPETVPDFFDEGMHAFQIANFGIMHARYVAVAIAPPITLPIGDTDETLTTYDPTAAPEFLVTAGWQSADVYKDIDKTSEAGFPIAGDPTGDKVHRTSIYYTKGAVAYKGFAFTATYLESIDALRPRVATGESLLRGELPPSPRRYQEVDLSLNYSHEIVPRLFDATVGYTAYINPDTAFWGTSFTGELYSTLTFKAIPHLRPNATFSLFNSGAEQLRGRFFDFRCDSYGLTVFKSDKLKLSIELNPYVGLGLDDGLVGDGFGLTAFRFGVRAPLYFGKHVVVNLDLNFAVPINGDSSSEHNFRTDLGEVGPWGGVSFSFRF